jgi:integrase
MDCLISKYIESKQYAWAKTTLYTEHSRLLAHAHLADVEPLKAFISLKDGGMKVYSIKTTLMRISDYYQWLIDNNHKPVGPNPFKLFFRSHANLFKYSYQPERLEITYAEAMERIEGIADSNLRAAARQLLEAGLRSCELKTINHEQVVGKGGKPREVFLPQDLKTFRYKGSYAQLYYALKKVGLKPHTLRKLCATEFSRQKGMTLIDSMESFGWSSMGTPAKYFQPEVAEKRGAAMRKARGA